MNPKVTILDPDYLFARMMSGRLKLYLPEIKITEYSGGYEQNNQTKENAIINQSDIVVYDNQTVDSDWLSKNHITLPTTHIIPMRESNNHVRASASKIYHHIQQLLNEKSEDNSCLCPSNEENPSGKIIYYLSFCESQYREEYIKSNTKSWSNTAHPIFRIDLMPGIKIPMCTSQYHKHENNLCSSGINELLQCSSFINQPINDLISYCQPDANGHYCLGRPIRSDDIINTDIHVLKKMINAVRKNIECKHSNACVITVIDGFPFSHLQKICCFAHEIHILLDKEKQTDDPLFRYELEELLSQLSPLQKKHILPIERNPS